MKDFAKTYLEKMGYTVNTNALSVISTCDNWYANRCIDNFHKRKNLNGQEIELQRLNMAKRCCSDDANLCEIISVTPEKESTSQAFIDELLRSNRFDVRYREQLERTAANGTEGAYIYLENANYVQKGDKVFVRGGNIKINYVDAPCIIPLTVENRLVTECAFCDTGMEKGKEKTTMVIFTKCNGMYQAETIVFDELGNKKEEESRKVQLGNVKPFSILQNAEVNNLDNMIGYGLPKIYNAIPYFMILDLCHSLLFGDLSKADKLVFLNEILACIQRDKNGQPYLTKQQKELFILLGEDGGRLPDEKSLVQEYNPKIRIDEVTKAFELALSLLSMTFGYGTKKYTFENGRITTATEYIGTKQDSMQELNRQRKQATDYIVDIIKSAKWFSNQFRGTNYNLDESLIVEFDDSFVIDREADLQRKKEDALSFDIPELTILYLMDAYNMSKDEATKLVVGSQKEDKEEELD